ncbi:hypothetical protein FHS38_006975 [Streptomyces netropsis]|uniref:Helicase associated domain protein n=1 Tax=Streptomyces netropsis TaxID=55404 RepID=A0A7W7PIB4_STRNE|nr:hypothetical protein [Streptomyces netropsis]
MTVKLGVWINNTKTRHHRLDAEQHDALRKIGINWA